MAWASFDCNEVKHNLDALEGHFSEFTITAKALPELNSGDKIKFSLNRENEIILEYQGKEFFVESLTFYFDSEVNFIGKIRSISYSSNTVFVSDLDSNYYEFTHSDFHTLVGKDKKLIMESKDRFIVEEIIEKTVATESSNSAAIKTIYTTDKPRASSPLEHFLGISLDK